MAKSKAEGSVSHTLDTGLLTPLFIDKLNLFFKTGYFKVLIIHNIRINFLPNLSKFLSDIFVKIFTSDTFLPYRDWETKKTKTIHQK